MDNLREAAASSYKDYFQELKRLPADVNRVKEVLDKHLCEVYHVSIFLSSKTHCTSFDVMERHLHNVTGCN